MPQRLRTLLILCLTAAPGLHALPIRAQSGSEEAAPASRIVQVLAERGFENVAVEEAPGRVTVWFESRLFRYPMVSLGAVLERVVPLVDSLSVLEIIPQNRGIALLALSAPAGRWSEFLAGRLSGRELNEVLRVDDRTRWGGLPLRIPGIRTAQRSYFRTDLAVRPLFSFNLGVADDPFQYQAALAPEAVLSPFHGGLLTLQAENFLHNDFDPCGGIPGGAGCGRDVIPGRNTLTWAGWLPSAWLFTVSGGLFPGASESRYGFAGEIGRLFLDGQLNVKGGGDVTGRIQFLEDAIVYSNLGTWSAFGAATWRTRGIDLATTLTLARYWEESVGARLDFRRDFHEFRVGLFGLRSDLFEVNGEGEWVAGFTLDVPLPLRRYAQPRTVRFTTVPDFPFAYRNSSLAVGLSITPYDNLDRLRLRLYPTYVRNNLEDMRWVQGYGRKGGAS
jgi:hypothetical protein